MNQAIQFPDREYWDEQIRAVCFPALVNGFQINCRISADVLARRYGGDSVQQWLSLFREHRWDLEDEYERMAQKQQYDDQGWLSLS
ncbi:DUF1488 domain-containing protein [Affinibrenneria salicis]|uniref:DUF1488 domain-containing protein n=1 Tax=Affinibrenneria salicis TaxID=2590031 RepID=A0A5J5FRG0_9GAMM|nr:DUF1488 domain-containing protein [Affinibrenneria salicis]KAA8994875.1 DUF1488 domain-containing protein [Affinibrenneria salicis]